MDGTSLCSTVKLQIVQTCSITFKTKSVSDLDWKLSNGPFENHVRRMQSWCMSLTSYMQYVIKESYPPGEDDHWICLVVVQWYW